MGSSWRLGRLGALVLQCPERGATAVAALPLQCERRDVSLLRVELDGRPADPAVLQELAFAGYGHFTSMQVWARWVQAWSCTWSGWNGTRGSCSGGRWTGNGSGAT